LKLTGSKHRSGEGLEQPDERVWLFVFAGESSTLDGLHKKAECSFDSRVGLRAEVN
jgi:hypothetical protein